MAHSSLPLDQKINVDAASRPLFIVGAVVARDDKGDVLGTFAYRIDYSNSLVMEASAMLEGVRLAISMGWNAIILESDCKELIVYLLESQSTVHGQIVNLVDNIRILLASIKLWDVVFISRQANFASHNLAAWAACFSSFDVLMFLMFFVQFRLIINQYAFNFFVAFGGSRLQNPVCSLVSLLVGLML